MVPMRVRILEVAPLHEPSDCRLPIANCLEGRGSWSQCAVDKPWRLFMNRRWADPKCPMSNEQCAMCNMCRLLNDLDFPLLIAHCSLLISGVRFRGSMRIAGSIA